MFAEPEDITRLECRLYHWYRLECMHVPAVGGQTAQVFAEHDGLMAAFHLAGAGTYSVSKRDSR